MSKLILHAEKLSGSGAERARRMASAALKTDKDDAGRWVVVTVTSWPEALTDTLPTLGDCIAVCEREWCYPCFAVPLKSDGTPHKGRAPWKVVP